MLNWSLTFQLCQIDAQPFILMIKWSLPLSDGYKIANSFNKIIKNDNVACQLKKKKKNYIQSRLIVKFYSNQ